MTGLEGYRDMIITGAVIGEGEERREGGEGEGEEGSREGGEGGEGRARGGRRGRGDWEDMITTTATLINIACNRLLANYTTHRRAI